MYPPLWAFVACSGVNCAFYLYFFRKCSNQHRILCDLLRRCVCAQWHWLWRRVLIADNEWTARRCCCCYLDVKPGGSGDGRLRFRTTSDIFFWQTLQTIQTTVPRTKMHQRPLPITFTAVTWSKNERYAVGSNLATQQKHFFDVLLLRLYFLLPNSYSSFTTSMPSSSRSRTIWLHSI